MILNFIMFAANIVLTIMLFKELVFIKNENKEYSLKLKERIKLLEKTRDYLELTNDELKQNNNFLEQKITEKEKYIEKLNKDIINESEKIKELTTVQWNINNQLIEKEKNKNEIKFYSINISNNDKEDIAYLEQILNSINNKDFINRTIYQCYYKTPLEEMLKRILKNEDKTGIYKITSLITGKCYIGKAVSIKKRWTEHIKTSLDIGALASSTLHRTMKEEGCWNFTFEVIEETTKEKLAEREAFWINFYQSNICGLNMKDGKK